MNGRRGGGPRASPQAKKPGVEAAAKYPRRDPQGAGRPSIPDRQEEPGRAPGPLPEGNPPAAPRLEPLVRRTSPMRRSTYRNWRSASRIRRVPPMQQGDSRTSCGRTNLPHHPDIGASSGGARKPAAGTCLAGGAVCRAAAAIRAVPRDATVRKSRSMLTCMLLIV